MVGVGESFFKIPPLTDDFTRYRVTYRLQWNETLLRLQRIPKQCTSEPDLDHLRERAEWGVRPSLPCALRAQACAARPHSRLLQDTPQPPSEAAPATRPQSWTSALAPSMGVPTLHNDC